MASLNELTVSLLDRLAKECGIKLKKSTKKTEKIAIIENAGIEEAYLEQLLNKYLAQKSILRKTSKDSISELKGRVKLLEEQVRFLMSEISVSKVSLSKKDDRDIITVTTDLADIKKFIKSIISPGESITIDELIELKEIQKIPLIALKHSIYDLIDENVFDVAEGNSRQKIGGKIGILIRK
jgi:tetrahydromethanopterin S-methyltransferase subunit G